MSSSNPQYYWQQHGLTPQTRPIKIAFVVECLNAAGMARDLIDLCSQLDRTRFAPMIFSLQGPGVLDDDIRALCISIHYVQCGRASLNWQTLSGLWRLGLQLRREKVVIVHGSHYWSSIVAAVTGRMAGARVVTNRIDLGFCLSAWPMRIAVNATNLMAHAVVANCEAVRQSVLRREFAVARKLQVINNGCDCSRAASVAHAADRKLLGLPAEGPIILNVSNLHAHKRHEWLLDALPSVLAIFPDAKVVIVGKDMGRLEMLSKLAQNLRITHAVTFTGPRRDVPALLAAASIGTLTSETEACSNTLLEYAAAGLPTVATNVGGNNEVILDGSTGFLVPPGDASKLAECICELLSSPSLARRMASAARRHVETKFSLSRTVKEYELLFAMLAAGKGIALQDSQPPSGDAIIRGIPISSHTSSQSASRT